ncbi:MAG: hypothetical protein B7X93_13565 [Hydrogenophilales bacterium 17-61-9]|jgi:hypothetical protein|nr:MAG: hypothetical protein B7X93_13565 [Hydrogenophilales bacterium 17-61-9]
MKIAPYHNGFFWLSKFRQVHPSAAKRPGHRLATAPMPPQGLWLIILDALMVWRFTHSGMERFAMLARKAGIRS